MSDLNFADADLPQDSVPETAEILFPCRVCGREAGPYSGRGPKPKLCIDHKKTPKSTSGKVTGSVATQAAQATAVLVQLNGMLAIGSMALGMHGTASAIAAGNGVFEEQAYQALITDPELCKLILKGGVKSGKVSLLIAYAGLGASVVPTAINEVKELKAERDARREAEANEAGTAYA